MRNERVSPRVRHSHFLLAQQWCAGIEVQEMRFCGECTREFAEESLQSVDDVENPCTLSGLRSHGNRPTGMRRSDAGGHTLDGTVQASEIRSASETIAVRGRSRDTIDRWSEVAVRPGPGLKESLSTPTTGRADRPAPAQGKPGRETACIYRADMRRSSIPIRRGGGLPGGAVSCIGQS